MAYSPSPPRDSLSSEAQSHQTSTTAQSTIPSARSSSEHADHGDDDNDDGEDDYFEDEAKLGSGSRDVGFNGNAISGDANYDVSPRANKRKGFFSMLRSNFKSPFTPRRRQSTLATSAPIEAANAGVGVVGVTAPPSLSSATYHSTLTSHSRSELSGADCSNDSANNNPEQEPYLRIEVTAESRYRLCCADPQGTDDDLWCLINATFTQVFYVHNHCEGRLTATDRVISIAIRSPQSTAATIAGDIDSRSGDGVGSNSRASGELGFGEVSSRSKVESGDSLAHSQQQRQQQLSNESDGDYGDAQDRDRTRDGRRVRLGVVDRRPSEQRVSTGESDAEDEFDVPGLVYNGPPLAADGYGYAI